LGVWKVLASFLLHFQVASEILARDAPIGSNRRFDFRYFWEDQICPGHISLGDVAGGRFPPKLHAINNAISNRIARLMHEVHGKIGINWCFSNLVLT
jgi:hypothetical protein